MIDDSLTNEILQPLIAYWGTFGRSKEYKKYDWFDGKTIKDAPTPKPPSIRNIKKEVNPVASAEPIALTVTIRAQYFSTNLRPYLSLKGPENIIPKAATMVNELTEKPSCRSDRLN